MRPPPARLERLPEQYFAALLGRVAAAACEGMARNPGAYWQTWTERVEAGTYEYFKP